METVNLQNTTAPEVTTAAPRSRAEMQQNQFLQLLVAQLKGQNPLNPTDGAEFVAQLAQFSSLEQLTQINQSLDNVQKLLTSPSELKLSN